jgi:tetratricopeptide (TPR) repeat protein
MYVYENPHIKTIDSEFIKWVFTSFYASNWHPLTLLSHAIDYAIWGLNPEGHHLTSIIFHGLNTFLVVILIMRLINYSTDTNKNLVIGKNINHSYNISVTASAITGLLFGLHPFHVESVAWISERKDVLYAFFFLLSLLLYIKYTSSALPKQKFLSYFLCLLFFVMALMSKPMAVTLPVVLIILDFYPLERTDFKSLFKSKSKVFIEKLPFLGLSLTSIVITILASKKEILAFEVNIEERFLVALQSLSFYLCKMLWPADLSPLYPYPSKISFFSLQYITAFILAVCVTAFCFWSWKRQKVFLAVWAYYVVTLLPVLGLIKVGLQAAADRYTYLPSLGPMLLIGLGLSRIMGKVTTKQEKSVLKRFSIYISTMIIISMLSIMTYLQIEVWRDSMTLWNRVLKLYSIPQAYNNRGNAYLMSGRYQQALEDYNNAIRLDPNIAKVYNNRGLTNMYLGRYEQALEDFNNSINLNNQESRTYYNRGEVFKTLNNYQRALEDYAKSIKLNPLDKNVYNNRGNVYLKLSSYQRAISDFNAAIEIDPKDDKVYFNRAIAYENLSKYEKALSNFKMSAQLGNKQAQDYLNEKGVGW